MTKKVTAEKQNLESKPLEVEVIIPEEVLKKENHFKGIYSEGKLTYNFGNELPENVKEEISQIIKSSKVDELVKFNPLLLSLVELQSFKDLKFDPEQKNDRDYVDSNKKIGSFNTAIKSTTDLMKKDANEYVKKVNAIRDFFLTEAKTTREILQLNFKPYLDEQERIKKEKEDKKNAKILEANEELIKKNQEQAEKLKNQQKESKKLTIQGEIGKITFSATSGVSVLNLDGLEKLKKETENKAFKNLLSDAEKLEYGFTEDEIFELENEFNNAISTSLKALGIAISNIQTTEENKNLKSENEVMKAQQPSNLLSSENDHPFSPNPVSSPIDIPISDKDKIIEISRILQEYNKHTIEVHTQISSIMFQDDGLDKIQKVIAEDSFSKILDWSKKLSEWTETKANKYVEFLNKVQTN